MRLGLSAGWIGQAKPQLVGLVGLDDALSIQVFDADWPGGAGAIRIRRHRHAEAVQQLRGFQQESHVIGPRYRQLDLGGVHAGLGLGEAAVGDGHRPRSLAVIAERAHGGVHALHVVVHGGIGGANHQDAGLVRALHDAIGDADVPGPLGCLGARGKAHDRWRRLAGQIRQVDHTDSLRGEAAHVGELAAEADLVRLVAHLDGVLDAVRGGVDHVDHILGGVDHQPEAAVLGAATQSASP